jgi:hypothetical protein
MSDPQHPEQQNQRPAPAQPVYGQAGYGQPVYAHGAPLAPKEIGIAYALMLFTLIGVAGIQHFYLGKVGRGILWLLTFGIFGIGTIVDLFTLPSQTNTVNARRAVGIS